MHDPSTQAFVIPWRWKWHSFGKEKRWRYWVPFITIWHIDPERHIPGQRSDDSCGWFHPPLNQIQREIIETLAQDEARTPWFAALDAKENADAVQCEALVRGAFLIVSMCLENRLGWRRWRLRKRPVTLDEATKWASEMVHNSIDNFRHRLAFKSGYHSNWYHPPQPNTVEEDKWFRQQDAESFFCAIMSKILRERRPWYRHPKWHILHWRLRIHFIDNFKRWAFSKCCKCGKGSPGDTRQ